MPYVNRDENNKIISIFANQQFEGQEYLPDYNEDVLNFGKPSETELHNQEIQAQIAELETKSARSLRDAILRQDTKYLAKYDSQIADLRSQLQ